MKIYVNEKPLIVEDNINIFKLKNIVKKHADIIVCNGFSISKDIILKPLDRVVFIKKGEIPSKEEIKAQLVARHTPKVYEKLKNACVTVAGLGGLGSTVALSLARTGIGKLILVDYDVVEPSNLNRQQYFIKHIGMKKTEAIKELIYECNPFIEVQTINTYVNEDNIQNIFKNSKIIVEAFDNAENKALLTNKVLETMKDTIIITASGMAGYGDCNLIKTRKINSRFFIAGDGEAEAKIGMGLMAPRTAVVANHQANIVLRLLIEKMSRRNIYGQV